MERQDTLIIKKINDLVEILSSIRITRMLCEKDIQDLIETRFKKANVAYEKEKRIGPRSRLDFLVGGVIGVEVKKRRPEKQRLISQLNRYVSLENIKGLLLVLERHMDLPEKLEGKPVLVLSLNKLWGPAI